MHNKKRKDTLLGNNKKEKISEKYTTIADRGSTLLELQKSYMKEEAERKLIEHDYKMDSLKLERLHMENQEKRRQEEHELKIKLLDIQLNNHV